MANFSALLSSTYVDEQTSKELHRAACGAGRDFELLVLEIQHPNDFVGKQPGQPKTLVSCDRFHYTLSNKGSCTFVIQHTNCIPMYFYGVRRCCRKRTDIQIKGLDTAGTASAPHHESWYGNACGT